MRSSTHLLVVAAAGPLMAGCGRGSSDSGVDTSRPNTTYNPSYTASGSQTTTCRVRSVRTTDTSAIIVFTKPSGASPCELNSLTAPVPYKQQVLSAMTPWKVIRLDYSGEIVFRFAPL